MKLAELLNERKAMKERITHIRERLAMCVRKQEGDDAPVEPPEELKTELIGQYEKLAGLIIAINSANMQTLVDNRNLMELIAERDKNIAIAASLHKLAGQATPESSRYSRNEIRFVPSIDIKKVRQEADRYAVTARELDSRIQAANWTTDI